MAGNGIFGKIQGGISGTFEKAKELTGNLTPAATEEVSLSGAKNQRKILMQEKQKYLCYMGMAAFSLIRDKKIEHEELEKDYEQLCDIDGQLDAMDQTIERLENARHAKNICECGAKLSKNDVFCPNCGKKIKEVIICKCGAEISSGMKYCGSCGAEVTDRQKETAPAEVWKTCICGAKVPEGQAMCMECGRIVE